MLAFFLTALVLPGALYRRAALSALALCYAVEVSQLWHTPWLDQLRAGRLGALVLGRGFLWSDLVCYTAGVLFAVIIVRPLLRRQP